MSGPRCRVRRAASPPFAAILRDLLQRGSHAPFGQQGRAIAANSTCRWSHFAYAISRRTSSSVRASLNSDRHTGVANGSLFTYFETKADLFNQLYLELKGGMASAALDGL